MLNFQIKKQLSTFELDVDVELPESAVLGLFGPSGCGKSMTLRCIAGLETPDSGKIRIGKTSLFNSAKGINLPPQQRKIGFLFQNYALFPHLTVEKNIEFGLAGMASSLKKRKVALAMERMRLTGLEKSLPHQISGGQQQRVALARTLITDPNFLLLDEPFSALDNHVKSRLEKEIIDIKNSFTGAIILVTHNLEEAYHLCTHIALMEEGKILQCGTRDEIIRYPANRRVARLVGTKNIFDGQLKDVLGEFVTLWVDKLGAMIKAPHQNIVKIANQTSNNSILGPSSMVSVGIRPKDVRINFTPTGELNEFPSIITRLIPGVDYTILYLKLDTSSTDPSDYDVEALISADNQNGIKISEGDRCFLSFPPNSLLVWKS